MTTEMITVILSIVLVVLAIFLYVYNKKNSSKKNELVNMVTVALIEVLAAYIKKNGKKDAKPFEELADYVVYVKDYLFGQFEKMLEDADFVPENMKKIFSNETINSILDNIINENMEIIEKAFVDSKKPTRSRKKKTEAVPEEAK